MQRAVSHPLSAVAALAALLAVPAAAAPPADWSAVPAKTVTLFYPGQSSFGWLRSKAHKGAGLVKTGGACRTCHKADTDAKRGEKIVTGGDLEPAPIPGKKGAVELAVQAAYDADTLYLRFRWPTQMARPGRMHDYLRFDGASWAFYGGPRSKDTVRSGAQPPLYEDRLALMIDDGSVDLFAEQGCWLTCHRGMRDMPDAPSKDTVAAHPRLGKDGLGESDIRKYLPATRGDEAASWDQVRSAEEVAALKAEGGFLDLMQWRAARSNAVGMADDGYVLEYRLGDEGKGPFSWNVDRKTMTPKYMFDAAKVGAKSLTVAEIGDAAKPYAMIREENAVPYDPGAGWKADDVLPGRLLSRDDASGSAADNSAVEGEWSDGTWTVVWARKLDTGHPADDKTLEAGKVYTFGFAVHDDNVTTRFHFVSFPVTLGLGAKADITAVKLD
ncbi:MAG: ethylbenzene dehydrogenase-related protein [Rhodospirillales bacterium]|nr:ethylbenzene dehydrogenase-related protein [Rhodospirillales bacterium]